MQPLTAAIRQFIIAMVCLGLLGSAAYAKPAPVTYRTVIGARDVPLQVVEAGPVDGPGVLLIHGASLSSSSWHEQLESALAENYHLVAFDIRGHGNSGKPWDPEYYNDSRLWADDVAAVIAATGLQRPVIVAWSFGGHVTLDYVRHYSAAALAGIVLVGSTGGIQPFQQPDPATAAEFVRLSKLAMTPDAGAQLAAARGFVTSMLKAPVAPATFDRQVAAVLAVTPYARIAMQGRSLDNSDMVEKLTVPVLFALGDADRTATVPEVSKLVARIPDSRLSVYPDTGHMPFIERRDRFNAELAAFLDANSAQPERPN